MAHVTFIHGIGNQPPPDELLPIWRRILADGDGIDLGAEGITSELVTWADVMYKAPSAVAGAHESLEANLEASVGRDQPEVDADFENLELSAEEAAFIESMRSKLNFDAAGDDDHAPPEEQIGVAFERIPLPWWLKRRLMKIFLRDVHHYLFNAENEPRPSEVFFVRDEIRKRLVAAIERGSHEEGPHVMIAHSMGSVIAYDCLKRVPDCPPVDGLITIGSPLGLDEIQDKMAPEWSRDDGYPSGRVKGKWVNVFDRLDPVAGLDPAFANDYRFGGQDRVVDVVQRNTGTWRHDAAKYLSGGPFREQLMNMLALDG